MAEMTIQYIAGFFDGEGSALIEYPKERKAARLTIVFTNTYLPVLEEIQNFFGAGSITKKHQKYLPHHKVCYWLRISGSFKVIPILEQMLPYLREKRAKAEEMLRIANELHEPKPVRLCSITSCYDKHLSLGYCSKHYQRLKLGKDLMRPEDY